MTAPFPSEIQNPHPGMGFREFVAMMACLMAVNALGIDMMLPALPVMGHELGIQIANHRQWIIAFYVAGFGIAMLIFGPLADRYGRRRVLFSAMAVYAVMSICAAHAGSFAMLLGARVLQGMAASSTRILSVSITRDCYAGRRMARVLSLTYMTFLAVPVLAPSLGQLVLMVSPWSGIFYWLGGFSIFVAIWAAIRLPETLPPAQRRPIRLDRLMQATSMTLRNRPSLGYTIALAGSFGGLMAFINSSQQLFTDTFDAARLFPLCFASVAIMIGVASLINSKIVGRYGTRRVSHSALLAMTAISIVHVLFILAGHETLVTFVALQAATMLFHGLTGSNFGAMAMEDMGEIAGSAASVQGFLSTLLGTGVGLAIGQSFHGTSLPLALGFTLIGLSSLLAILYAERGQLFRPHHEAA